MSTVISSIEAYRYNRIASKVIGSSHVLKNSNCQDATSTWPMTSVPSVTAVMAVADGHGHHKHNRSALGSFLAVESATEVLAQCAKQLQDQEYGQRLRDFWVDKVPKKIFQRWERRVKRCVSEKPYQASEFYGLKDKDIAEKKANPLVGFGTTLLTATITPHFLALVRIGDGVIVTCSDSGELSTPFNEQDEDDERTASLCSRNVLSHFEVEVIPLKDNAPAMVLLTTDGYQKDCGTVKEFLPYVSTLFDFARTHSTVEFADSIDASLVKRAKTAPDDLTFGILLRSDITKES